MPRHVSILIVAFASLRALATDGPSDFAFFESRIRPVLIEKCYSCHSAEAEKVKGGLLLDTREGIRKGGDTAPAVVPGDVKGSLLVRAIHYEDDLEMPPKERLSAEVVADFEKWIATGAVDPRDGTSKVAASTIDIEEGRKHWAFQPIAKPAVPSVKDTAWPKTDIDRFILAGHSYGGMVITGVAGRLGLPETNWQIDAICYVDAFLPQDGELCRRQPLFPFVRGTGDFKLGGPAWQRGKPGGGEGGG